MASAVLIDTHFLLWIRMSPQNLTRNERNILDGADAVWVSAVSLFEIAILLGRGRIPGGDATLLSVPSGLDWLPIAPDHCKALAVLPRLHGDPFDRMLIAQAQSEQVPLLTRDHVIQGDHQH